MKLFETDKSKAISTTEANVTETNVTEADATKASGVKEVVAQKVSDTKQETVTVSQQEIVKASQQGKKAKSDTKKKKGFRLPFRKNEEESLETKSDTVQKEHSTVATTPYTTFPTTGGKPSYVYKPYKPLVDEKLTILLVENTSEVAKELPTIIKIINGIVKHGVVCIINYGSKYKQSVIMPVSKINNTEILISTDLGENACLYDALVMVEFLVSQKLLSIEEKEKQRVKISNIDVIGFGTCKEQGSKVLKEFAISAFARITDNNRVVTKYFCLTEANFLQAAEVGFHSIGSMSRNY